MSAIEKPPLPNFAGAVLKVQRAQRHIVEFEAEAERFFRKRPHQVSFQPYAKRQRYGFSVSERVLFPDLKLGAIVGDVVHNLRTSLDYLIAACALANGRSVNDTHFPIVDLRSQLPARLHKDVRKAGPIADRLVRKAKPYRRGNRTLHAIHKLDLTDKHRVILPVACTAQIEITAGVWNDLPLIRLTTNIYGSEGHGKFVAVPEGYETALYNDVSVTSDIVFARQQPFGGRPCIETLHALCEAVTDVIESFEMAFGCIRLADSLRQHLAPVTSGI